ncbi:hypothetical protein GLW07_19195 [Bacillus hwajinpoensis]|uniref:DUF4365 domain-containing protein n=1 Tax=Guptibacillus hwajinpoensis TaxID=208199 RepID=A0A845F419_9BACL|nr:hypothetical protein [Pseudalkalibacillus hwajinpoensis]MYL65488.1 hypothetical protein [Pseudalkalibacillus hwajinpoensis]
MLIENNKLKDEDYEELIFTSLTYDVEKTEITDIFNHDFIQFGLKDNIRYPIKNTRLGAISLSKNEIVEVHDEKIEVKVETIYKPANTIKVIEDSLELSIDNEGKKLKFTLKQIKSLDTQLKLLPILINFLKIGEFQFEDFYGEISLEEGKEYLTDLETTYTLFLNLKKIFNELQINDKTLFGNKDNIQIEIEHLIEIMLDNNYDNIKIKNPENPSFFQYSLGNVYIILFYNPTSEIKFVNAFSQDVYDLPASLHVVETNEIISISPYILLPETSLVNAVNLNYKVIIESFDSIEFNKIDIIFEYINNFCLLCLNAYDKTEKRQMLELPLYLLNRMEEETSDNIREIIIKINLLQTYFRINKELSSEEFQELLNLKDRVISLPENLELKFCISVLMESEKESEILFQQFSEERQNYFKALPIYFLYENM